MTKVFLLAKCKDLAKETEVFPVENFATEELASLMVDAYGGTVDWEEGDDETVALVEIRETMSGKYGSFEAKASGVIVDSLGNPVSALLVSIFEGRPTIIFLFTRKDHLKQGFATSLIRNSAHVLQENGHSEFALYVSSQNPARVLYESLGFTPA